MADQLDHAASGTSVGSIPKRHKAMEINYDWCKGCGICIAFCPEDCFDISSLSQPLPTRLEVCTACLICVQRCPDYAIVIDEEGAFPTAVAAAGEVSRDPR